MGNSTTLDKLTRDSGFLDNAIRKLETTIDDKTSTPKNKREAYVSFLMELGRFLKRHPSVHVQKQAGRSLQALAGELDREHDSCVFPFKRPRGRPIDVYHQFNHAWGAAIVSSLKNRGIPLKVAAKRVAVALDRKDTPIKSDRRSGQHWKRVINLRKDLQRKKPKPHQIDMKLIYDDTVQWLDVSPEMGEDWLSDSD